MKDARRYIIGVLLIIIAIMLIVLGFRAIANVFSNDDPEPVTQAQNTESDKKVDLLAAPDKNDTVRYTVRGSVMGNEQHRSIRITVNRDERRVEVLEGYDDHVIKSQSSQNTQEAYQAFVEALYGAGFTRTVDGKDRGVEAQSCPLGRRFNFEMAPGRSNSYYSWSTSCSNKLGTFAGSRNTIDSLFHRQIPDYGNFVSGIQL